MMASPMVNNQSYPKGGEATMKKTKTLPKQPMEEILNFFSRKSVIFFKNLEETYISIRRNGVAKEPVFI